MTSRRYLPALLLLSILLPGTAVLAQSPFALVNIGADVRQSDARVEGRGGWGLAERDSLNPSFLNTAGLVGLDKVAVLYSSYGEHTVSESTTGSRTSDTLRTPSLRLALPVNRTLIFTTGFRALRATQYKMRETISGAFPDSDPLLAQFAEVYEAEFYFSREGTQYEVPLGVAYQPRSWVSLGFSVNLVRGSIKEYLDLSYKDPVSTSGHALYKSSRVHRDDSLSGTSVTISAQFHPYQKLALGFTLTPSHVLDFKRVASLDNVAKRFESAYTLDVPMIWAVGGSLHLGGRWSVGGDYEMQNFSQMVGGDWDGSMVDAYRIGFGIERAEAFRRRAGLNNRPLRLGYTQAKWPYTVNGAEIMDKRISIGTGLTFSQQGGHLDLALSYGIIGDKAEHGFEDRVWRMSVSLLGFEKWW